MEPFLLQISSQQRLLLAVEDAPPVRGIMNAVVAGPVIRHIEGTGISPSLKTPAMRCRKAHLLVIIVIFLPAWISHALASRKTPFFEVFLFVCLSMVLQKGFYSARQDFCPLKGFYRQPPSRKGRPLFPGLRPHNQAILRFVILFSSSRLKKSMLLI